MVNSRQNFDLNGDIVTAGHTDMVNKRMTPNADWSNMTRTDHFVQFYEKEDHIINSVAEYVSHGIKVGETCIVAAPSDHIRKIEKTIIGFGYDIETARRAGKYISLDAHETLAEIMNGDAVDAKSFSKLLGLHLEKSSKNGGRTRIFGELVAVLLAEGNGDAAVDLEGFWNDLRKKYPFELFCAYPLDAFSNEYAAKCMTLVCDSHSQVIPGES